MEYEHGVSLGDSDREKPKLTTPNQQNAQNYSSDVYNITLNIYTRLDPQGKRQQGTESRQQGIKFKSVNFISSRHDVKKTDS